MNYKDPENILLIICGTMGIALFSLIFRYLFLELGFDAFGANLVFIIIFVIGSIFYISYLELIQKIGSLLFKKKEQPNIELVENEIVESIEETKPDLDSLREKHKQEEQHKRERLLEDAIEYTRTTFAPYATDENINRLCDYITDYYNGVEFSNNTQSVTVKDLSNIDLYHFGWNIWNHFKSVRNNKQEDVALFLKIVFARNLKDVDTDTIRKKLTFNEGKFKIRRRRKLFSE